MKRKAIFLFCKEQQANCVFLQETHSAEADTKFWKTQWGESVFFSHGTSHSAGVMILFNRFPGNVIDCKSDSDGHWLMIVSEINGSKYILLCVYGYTNRAQNKKLLTFLCEQLEQWKLSYLVDKVVVGGDFNIAPDPSVDRLPSRTSCHSYDESILNLVNKVSLCDAWRLKNPSVSQFTWFNSSNNGQCSRIDYWLVSNNLINNISKCEISASPLTDHCLISLFISLTKVKHQSLIWKFNNNLLHNDNFCLEVRNLIVEIDKLDMSHVSKWEWFKFQVKQVAIQISKSIAKQKRQEQQSIIERINRLCCKQDLSLDEHIQLNTFQSQLDKMFLEKANGAYVRSRARWIEEGEKNSSYFFNLEKYRQSNKKIQSLNIKGVLTEDHDKINVEILHFYSNLYKSTYSTENGTVFLESLRGLNGTLDVDIKVRMESKLAIEELDKAIGQMPRGKSPGIDGLTVEFYSFFWHDIRLTLYSAYLECISSTNLSPTMKQGLITLIPKPNKDKLLLDNWRPITLLCNDYKLLAHVYANRLNDCLTHLVDECQSAFIKGRHIHNHIRLIFDMLDYRQYIKTESLVLFLDFYKAFDTVEHPFLLKALNFLGFGDNFCNVIKMFYSNISSSVSLNPGMTPRFEVQRGIRQGCPISPKLFILTTQLLALIIQKDPDLYGINIFDKEFKISQFADDTALFLRDKSMVAKALNTISLFSQASGLCLNINKCELLPIHTCSDSNIASIRVELEVKYLGIVISKNMSRREDNNICNRIVDMKKSLSRWLTRDITIFGRVILSKAEGISKLIYPCHSLYVSPQNIRKANSIIFQFLWKNKTHYIKRSQLVKDYEKGGVRALDFESMIGTFKINWLRACLSQSDSMWFHIPRSLFKELGGIDFLLKCDFETSKIPVTLSNFHKQILHFWKMMFTHNFSPHMSTLWNNRVITANKKTLFIRNWFESGILFVTDLLDLSGALLDYVSFSKRHNFNCPLKEYRKVCCAIPLALRQLIRNTMLHSEVNPALPNLKIGNCILNDSKCNNKFISVNFKSILFQGFNSGRYLQALHGDQSLMEKAFSKFIQWPVSPKVKETHFKIINNIYPVSEFLKRRFKFEVNQCAFCDSACETLHHLFFSCPVSAAFWLELHSWLSLKINDIPQFSISDIIFYMAKQHPSVSTVINIVILLGKYHIHCCKWRNRKPSFTWFINDFKHYFMSLKKLKSSRFATIYDDISHLLLF